MLLVAGYVLLVVGALLQGSGGFAAAVAAASGERARENAALILSVLCLVGFAAAIALGVGLRAAFSEGRLRRYPLTRVSRIAVRHLLGMLDPVWLLLLAATTGMAVGFAATGVQGLVIGLPVAWLFVLLLYAGASALLSAIEHVLRRRHGFLLIGTVALAGALFVGASVSDLASANRPTAFAAAVFSWFPPHLAAQAMTSRDAIAWIGAVLALSGWLIFTLGALLFLEKRRSEAGDSPASRSLLPVLFDRLARPTGRLAPLVGKSLRYHVRCDRVCFNGAVTIPMISLMSLMTGRHSGPSGTFFIALGLFFLGGLLATHSMTLNQFGYDGAGLRRYLLLPVSFSTALRAGGAASLIVGTLILVPSLLLWVLLFGREFGPRLTAMLVLSAAAGLLFFTSLGLWMSFLAPRPVSMRGVMGNVLSGPSNVLMGISVFGCFAVAFVLIESVSLQTARDAWWLMWIAAASSALFYRYSYVAIAGREEEIRLRVVGRMVSGAGA